MDHIVCVPYYSLPEFPENCTIVNDHRVAIRDILLCHPNNFHVRGGAQYDPHVETVEYMNCQPGVRRQVANRIQAGQKVIILFRTRFVKLDGGFQELITGQYEIEEVDLNIVCRDAPVIKASKAKFVSIEDAIIISKVMQTSRAYRSCFTSKNIKWKKRLMRWAVALEGKKDETSSYVNEIQRLKMIYRDNELPGDTFYNACGKCRDENGTCPLIRRRKRYSSLLRLEGHWT